MLTFPNAKINLGLNITEKRPDGYHNLETIFYPVPIEDALEINILNEGNGKFRLHQAGLEIEGEAEALFLTGRTTSSQTNQIPVPNSIQQTVVCHHNFQSFIPFAIFR